jgi:hypothetical protein
MMFDEREIKIPVDEVEWETLIRAWIDAENSVEKRSDYDEPKWWAVNAVGEWHLEDKHEALWEFIIRTFEREMSDKAFGILAAGPVENLLSEFGESYIERVEELARKNPRFNFLLGGVWQLAMTEDVWARLQKARLTVW